MRKRVNLRRRRELRRHVLVTTPWPWPPLAVLGALELVSLALQVAPAPISVALMQSVNSVAAQAAPARTRSSRQQTTPRCERAPSGEA